MGLKKLFAEHEIVTNATIFVFALGFTNYFKSDKIDGVF